MLKENIEMEYSIANAKVMAREKQPIRHDVYLQHASYYEDMIKTLHSVIQRMSEKEANPPQVSYYFSIDQYKKTKIGA